MLFGEKARTLLPGWHPSRFDSAVSLAAFVALPLALGSFFALLSSKQVLTWFQTLRKPRLQPPDPVFGQVWSIMYAFMGLAAWMVWTHGGWHDQKAALTLYAIQLALNCAWQPLFFNAHRMDWALADILALNVVLAATAWAFHRVEPLAGVLLLPYMAWVAFATYINRAFLQLNPPLEVHTTGPGQPAKSAKAA
ncbi:hypothetical protein WJX81_003389 [Elliptochloris bilobata]|uniref:Uncharacterized protein n=1 Tax=Elliptochloris bilobata TaxID=381761 RepID=A0AAW1SIE9_9CHLO